MSKLPLQLLIPWIAIITCDLAGCSSGDGRLADFAEQSVEQQSAQNQEMARQNARLAEATKSLIEADARTHADMLEVQQQVQSERQDLNRRSNALAAERQSFLKSQLRAPIVAQAILTVGAILAAIVPLLLGLRLFQYLGQDQADTIIADALLTEFVQPDSVLLPCFPALALPGDNLQKRIEVAPTPTMLPTLCVVESRHDVEFLQRISQILHLDDSQLPDLVALEAAGRLRLLPVGGDDLRNWPDRLDGLGHREFHLYDREVIPVTAERKVTVDRINSRTGCVAWLTGKRALENYLHPAAVRQVLGLEIDIDDTCDVAEQVARQLLTDDVAWGDLPHRQKRRLRNKAKQRLNTDVVAGMTAALLDERDPRGEVRGWLRQIAELS